MTHALYGYFMELYGRGMKALEARRVALLAQQRLRQEAITAKEAVDLEIDWDAERMEMAASLCRALDEIVGEAMQAVRGRYTGMNISVSWEVWDRAAAELAQKYQYDLITDLTNSTREQLGRAIAEWIERGDEFPALVADVRRIIPPGPVRGVRDRAQVIAATEVTRIYALSRVAGMQAAGLTKMHWRTAEDELVCPICGPLGEANEGRGAEGSVTERRFVHPENGNVYGPPPAHPNCRCWIVESPEELQALMEASRAELGAGAPQEEQFPFRIDELKVDRDARLGGAHRKTVYVAPDGSKWLFKPQDEFRAYGDKVAYDLAKALGHPAAETYVVEIDGQIGSIQRMFDNIQRDLGGVDPRALTREQVIEVQKEHIFDWLIGNHDGHAENLLLTSDGHIVGIDKGQLFKFYDRDRLDWDYNPNSNFGVVSYHNRLLQRWVAGEDVPYFDPRRTRALKEFLQAIQELPDEEFVRIIRPYAEAAARFRVGPNRVALAYQDLDTFLARAVERKNRIAQDFADLYRRASAARKAALGRLEVSADVLTPITQEFVEEVEHSGWQGKALLLGGEDIEDMTALVYRLDGDGTAIEMRVRLAAENRMLARLSEFQGGAALVQHGDPYWDDVLTVAKSYNYHLKPGSPGYDGAIPEHTKQKIDDLYRKLADALNRNPDDEIARHYIDYVMTLAQEVRGIKPLGSQVGKVVEPFRPRAKKPARGRRYRVAEGPAATFAVRNRRGRIEYTPGERTFSGKGFRVDFGDGIRANYTLHADGNGGIYSKQGRLQIQIEGDLTPQKLEATLDHLKELGLDARLATRKGVELLYLAKTSYAAGVDPDDIGIRPGMTVDQKIEAYKSYWNRRLGVEDITKLPGYQPMPRFDSAAPVLGGKGRFGIPRWRRFDITEEELDRAMADYYLVHRLYGGSSLEALQVILEHNGALVSTEEKYRIGVPIGGMSPVEDQRTGGAGYVFTRIASGRRARSAYYHLLFDKRLLLDTDTISYDFDAFGNTHPDHIRRYRKRTIQEWRAAATRSSNETLIKRNLSLPDYLVGVNVQSETEKEQVIALLRKHGITRLGGRPLSQAVKVVR